MKEKYASFLAQIVKDHIVYLFLIAVLIIAAILSPQFFKLQNLFNILRQASALGLLAIGQTVVVIAGGIDVSVAAIMQLAGVTIAEITKAQDKLVFVAIVTVLFMGTAIGFGNGLLVAKRKVQPFVSTLFVGLLVTGLRLLVTKATPSGGLPAFIRFLGSDSLGPIPNAVIIFGCTALMINFILSKTTLGRSIYAVGGNPATAFFSGVKVDRITIFSYMLCGFLAAIAGLVLVGYLGYADQNIGIGYEWDSIAAVAVGGVVLGGGRGKISGTIAGVLLMTVLLNLVLILKLSVEYQFVIRGVVIIAAVAFYAGQWRWKRLFLSKGV
ncbi:MAG: ABC transporter permease [Desulfobacterales bacterium]|nr:MAG: ABC transporter permease [Desulfobacterales bacterium]